MERNRPTQYKKHKQQDPLMVLLLVLLLVCFILAGIYLMRNSTPAPAPEHTSTNATTTPPSGIDAPPDTEAASTATQSAAPVSTQAPPADDGWALLLVNAEHPLPDGYTFSLKELRNGQFVDVRIYPALQEMFDDARAVGIYPLINESYRTVERQQEILNDYIASYEAQGLSHDDAVAQANTIVAAPGTSEHQLGLAVDIIAEYDADSTATWQWLQENAWRYGFILRYPADKVDITGISYEPWHFRYVGKEAAKEITERGLCLEEYVADAG